MNCCDCQSCDATGLSGPDKLAESLLTIRESAEEILQIATENPTAAVMESLAQIPTKTYRAFLAALRYPNDDHELMRVL